MHHTTDSANLYRLQTTRRPVTLTMVSGDELKGHVFAHWSSSKPFETQETTELFNDEEPFFPFEMEGGEVILVAKARVAEVGLDLDGEPPENQASVMPFPTALLQVVLAGGAVRLGSIRLEVPPDRSRVLDYLNRLTSRFVTLYTSNDARLINRSLIDRVRPLD